MPTNLYLHRYPSHLNPQHLQAPLLSSNFSCHRFPALSSERPASLVGKLAKAVTHSSVVVSVFCREKFLKGDESPIEGYSTGFGFKEVYERMVSVPDSDHQLVGFGRAVSDGGLTASIHDVVVMPSMRRLGIGCKILGRIVRVLTSRQIYDISALCSEKERYFLVCYPISVELMLILEFEIDVG
ncbi:uncharacterized protein A4U43_C02F17390 [Asparagus officinalis]|uniref:N-acetyltransferase domain-containing protein n=1 Tax=Asparagus officinalis TaxID=4686 RepID=A0A5P1FJ67_ASPOF|nr:uncharacterized protein A4U43_C02F17390 [Asparagus officinalis]